ncbi:hypothetical protein [Bacillus benzoevorans]|uniref:Uncharacterized protein n=1 Tax=Bacillus benzoevorans TaxID=1456 RepID=A0A7X0LV26_9BACI|nr:hypothetical protein [Bacillus benzoevorans]MBB6445075.1 hypothetical protein [Bacillus benzoevorans]
MEVNVVSNGFHIVKTRDQIGGTLRTDVFELDTGRFQAFSNYIQDKEEEIIGFAESFNAKEAIRLSRKDLRKQWQSAR